MTSYQEQETTSASRLSTPVHTRPFHLDVSESNGMISTLLFQKRREEGKGKLR